MAWKSGAEKVITGSEISAEDHHRENAMQSHQSALKGASEPVRWTKIFAVRNALAEGRYQVSNQLLAACLLKHAKQDLLALQEDSSS